MPNLRDVHAQAHGVVEAYKEQIVDLFDHISTIHN